MRKRWLSGSNPFSEDLAGEAGIGSVRSTARAVRDPLAGSLRDVNI
jgi:hypothetical protein